MVQETNISLILLCLLRRLHLPLTLGGARDPSQAAPDLLYLAGVALGIRLIIARVDPWSGRSLLVVGLLHSSFNATENLLQPDYFWVRIAITIALGIAVKPSGRQPHPPSQGQSPGHRVTHSQTPLTIL